MDKLYAPWRDGYVREHIHGEKDNNGCIFCAVFLLKNEKEMNDHYVLYRNNNVAVMLNLYPYNGGHLLIFSANHVEQLFDIPRDIQEQLIQLSSLSMKIIKETLNCNAINFGANIGKDAGAGIPEHMHLHIVPRWQGDTGFFPVIGDTKQVSVDLNKIFNQLKPVFDNEFHERKL